MVEILSLVLNALLGSGVVGMFLFYRAKRKKENVSASSMEFEALVAQLRYLKEQIKENFADMDNMQNLLDKKRTLNIELSRKVGELELRLVEEQRLRKLAQYNVCTNETCIGRTPPRINNSTN